MQKIILTPEIYSFNIDAGCHVSNIAYVQWMEMGRCQLLCEAGLTLAALHSRGIAPVLTDTRIHYRHPLYLGDRVRIELWLTRLGRASAHMRIHFYHESGERDLLVADAEQKGGFFLLADKRPYRLEPTERALLLPYLETRS